MVLFIGDLYPTIYVDHGFYIHSPTVGHFACFQVSGIIDKASANLLRQEVEETKDSIHLDKGNVIAESPF